MSGISRELTDEDELHAPLALQAAYYDFVRPHSSFRRRLARPISVRSRISDPKQLKSLLSTHEVKLAAIVLGKWYFQWEAIFMAIKTRMDSAGRIVIPKELRERYGFDRGTPLRIIPLPDGVSIVAEQRERRFIRIGPVLAIDTGADSSRIDEFDVDRLRDKQLGSKLP